MVEEDGVVGVVHQSPSVAVGLAHDGLVVQAGGRVMQYCAGDLVPVAADGHWVVQGT